MKKFTKLAMLSLMVAGSASAQVATLPENGWYTYGVGILPKSFSADGKAKIHAAESLGGNLKIYTYNSSFNVEHSFEVIPQILQSKYVTERRAVVATPGEWFFIDTEGLTYVEKPWSQFSQEEKIGFLRSEGEYLLRNFGYYIYFRRDSIYTDANGDVYMYLINNSTYDDSGSEECTVGTFYLNGETLKFQPITYSRTGEWEVVKTEEYEYTDVIGNIWSVIDIDGSDWIWQVEDPVLATQTLFNTDAKYEYIRNKYTTYSNRAEGDERDTDGDGITDVRNLRSGYDRAGIEVVSEDGNIIASFDFSDFTLILWEGKRYLGFHVDGDNPSFQIYEINPNGNSITRASSEAFMHILPAMPRKNTSVTVEFGEESVKGGGQLMITDMNGRTVYRNTVAPGETSVRVPLHRMTSGVYNVTLVNGGKKVESSKLIVR